jgi:hypothetical protein
MPRSEFYAIKHLHLPLQCKRTESTIATAATKMRAGQFSQTHFDGTTNFANEHERDRRAPTTPPYLVKKHTLINSGPEIQQTGFRDPCRLAPRSSEPAMPLRLQSTRKLGPTKGWTTGLVLSLNPVLHGDSVGKALLGLRGFGAGCIGFNCFR